eukprot:CAMPEP_0202688536 /NCGR_PEP_ID=MMETSP1385-20130828/4033_1 /ASSEMBLY_ACC=CAM_ASM_000861 /TAXON_ID=933848 /ORGANISM="Elphidium margaritaceum" /LENGTH=183 /DNA_ID=CAMNT_0049343529 /DNA_START=132 /DNA_END=683 /DNA_ORIENTATION=-
MVSSYFYSRSDASPHFHVKHRNKINIMQKSDEIQRNRQCIIDELRNIYNLRPHSKTEFIYAEDAHFENPLIAMQGKKSITTLIHGLPLFSREARTESDSVEHYEDAMVLKQNWTVQVGSIFRVSFPVTTYLELNDANDQIQQQTDMPNDKELFEFIGCQAAKYLNGNGIARIVFGVPSGRYIE